MKYIKRKVRMAIADIRLRYAVMLADREHVRRKCRVFVMPDERDRLIIIDRREFRAFKMRGQIVRHARVDDMIRESFYYSPCRDGSRQLTERQKKHKRIMYLRYMGF